MKEVENRKVILVTHVVYISTFNNTIFTSNEPIDCPHTRHYVRGNLTERYGVGSILALEETQDAVPQCGSVPHNYWTILTNKNEAPTTDNM